MGLGPILPGRFPASLAGDRLSQLIASDRRALIQLQDQVASGQKFFVPSDDPAAAVRTVVLQKALERKEQLQANVQTDRSLLAASESALANVGDALNQARALTIAGTGDTVSAVEKQALAIEARSLLRQAINAGNTTFRGRYLFGGSQSLIAPFEDLGAGVIRYNGDEHNIDSFIDSNLLLANNVDGNTAFNALTEPIGDDVDPALTLNTKIADLFAGQGAELGSVFVTLDNGVPQTQTVDLSNAETIGDIKTILEDAFSAGPLTLTVDADPATNFGLRLSASAGTVAVSDVSGSMVAADLGIVSGPVAQINGGDLDPRLTIHTLLSDLNAGTGIGATAGNGLFVSNGPNSTVLDISTAATVGDLFNLFEAAGLDLHVGFNDAGNGLAISSRLSGASFSIGENNGANATNLGIRTLVGATLLADLNFGQGVPVDDGINLDITRRDGSNVPVDLSGSATVQGVLDAINAVDPGNLVAAMNTVGNGISILDNSGISPLIVSANSVSTALGIDGVENSPDPTVPLVGKDVNPQESNGAINILAALELALTNGDDIELSRISRLIDSETERFNQVRAEIGSRLRLIDDVENRLLDEDVAVRESLSEEFDVDITEVVTQLVHRQQSLEATLRIAAQTMQLSLLSFL